MSRVHIGSGTVYLDGYINVDLPYSRAHLAADRPDLVAVYRTTENRYYARHQANSSLESFGQGPRRDEYVCDRYGSWTFIPVPEGSATEVLGRQSFEHLSMADAHRALRAIKRALMPSGRLRLSVPDHEETMRRFIETRNPILIRHLLGPRTDDFGYHMMSYTHASLDALVRMHGFEFVGDEENIHSYPALCMVWRRP